MPSCRLHQQEAEIGSLGKTLAGLHSETARLNSLLAETTGLHTSLNEDNFLLETKITNQLKVTAVQLARLLSPVHDGRRLLTSSAAMGAVGSPVDLPHTLWSKSLQTSPAALAKSS
jgi:hypothetical protein